MTGHTPNPVPEPAANWYGTRRHYSTDLKEPSPDSNSGRCGRSLCSTESFPVEVFDQAAVDRTAETYRSKRVVIAELPECKKCARIVARSGGVR